MAKNTEKQNNGQKKPGTKKGFWGKTAEVIGTVIVAIVAIPFIANKN